MDPADFEHLRDNATIHFEVAARRGAQNPMGIAVQMRDGSLLTWDNVRSDDNEGDELLALPLTLLLDNENLSSDDLTRAQEVTEIVICTPFYDMHEQSCRSPANYLSATFKKALADYPGIRDGQTIYVVDPDIGTVQSFKL